uniref:Uncharacterized protein n=1 Tax=Arundo donax TaxID=35708 RepID=A0A0A9DJY5_ARUDO
MAMPRRPSPYPPLCRWSSVHLHQQPIALPCEPDAMLPLILTPLPTLSHAIAVWWGKGVAGGCGSEQPPERSERRCALLAAMG